MGRKFMKAFYALCKTTDMDQSINEESERYTGSPYTQRVIDWSEYITSEEDDKDNA